MENGPKAQHHTSQKQIYTATRSSVKEMGQLSWVDVANNQDLAVCQTEDVKHRQESQMLLNNAGENWFHAQPDEQDCEQGGRDATESHDGISTQRRCREGQQRLKAVMMVGYCQHEKELRFSTRPGMQRKKSEKCQFRGKKCFIYELKCVCW